MIRGVFAVVVGTAAFVAITLFEQLPVLGWLGGIVSIAAWVALTRAFLAEGGGGAVSAGMDIGWAAIVGGWTGFIGAVTAWLAQTGNLFGLTTPPGDRFGAAFGFLGASLALLYWPCVGALVCAIAAFIVTGGRVRRRGPGSFDEG